MDNAAELTTEALETIASEFWECRNRFALKIKNYSPKTGGRKNPVTTDRPESWKM